MVGCVGVNLNSYNRKTITWWTCCCDKTGTASQQHHFHSWQRVAPCCIGPIVSWSSLRRMSSTASGLILTCTSSLDDTLVTDEYFLNWIFRTGECPEPAACIQAGGAKQQPACKLTAASVLHSSRLSGSGGGVPRLTVVVGLLGAFLICWLMHNLMPN